METIKDYTVHIDSKKRVTLRGALYQYYNVREYANGCIMLEPRELTVPESISAKTLEDMDRAIENFKMGTVSPAIDLSDFQGDCYGMGYAIRMGIPEMDELWNTLKTKHRDGTIDKKDEDSKGCL